MRYDTLNTFPHIWKLWKKCKKIFNGTLWSITVQYSQTKQKVTKTKDFPYEMKVNEIWEFNIGISMKDVPIPKRRSYLIPLGHKDISWSSMQMTPPRFIFMTGICALKVDWGRFYCVLTGKYRKIHKIVVKYIKSSVLSNGKSEDRKSDLLFI